LQNQAGRSMADAGWVWEGQGLDPGVHPSIFGVGEGADFFSLRKVHFMFHDTTDLALTKLRDKEAVVCDVSKWRFRDCGEHGNGSESYCDGSLESVCAEAEKIGLLSQTYPNLRGGFYDDMKGLMQRHGHSPSSCAAVSNALRKHNPGLTLECVVYSHELDYAGFWEPLQEYIDVVSFWIWKYQDLADIERHVARCREVFPGKPISMGCYLRDYTLRAPVPMDAIRHQWTLLAEMLEDGRVAAFDILGAVLIDGHLEQACWVRNFIQDH